MSAWKCLVSAIGQFGQTLLLSKISLALSIWNEILYCDYTVNLGVYLFLSTDSWKLNRNTYVYTLIYHLPWEVRRSIKISGNAFHRLSGRWGQDHWPLTSLFTFLCCHGLPKQPAILHNQGSTFIKIIDRFHKITSYQQ